MRDLEDVGEAQQHRQPDALLLEVVRELEQVEHARRGCSLSGRTTTRPAGLMSKNPSPQPSML
jgi:hypothetical protein